MHGTMNIKTTRFLTCSNRPGPTLPSILWVPGLTQTGREVDCSRNLAPKFRMSAAIRLLLCCRGVGRDTVTFNFALGLDVPLNGNINLV
jgi:hypothetical protein